MRIARKGEECVTQRREERKEYNRRKTFAGFAPWRETNLSQRRRKIARKDAKNAKKCNQKLGVLCAFA